MPLPEPAPGEIRVRLCAAALNPVDAKLATGGNSAWTYPHIPGVDGAGWVDAFGEGATRFAMGDRVLAHFPLSKPGTLAEFALIQERAVCQVPQTVSLLTAATLPCAAWTAWQALTRKLYLGSRQTTPTILIEAAAGGVGGFAVQMAKHLGATVIATCSDANRKYVSELGADHVIDYRSEDVSASILQLTGGRGVDAVLDSLGGPSGQRDLGLLAYAGSMACLINLPDVSKINVFRLAPSLHFITLGGAWLSGDRAALLDFAKMGDEVLALLTTGALQPLPMTVVAFDAKAVTHALHQQLDGRVRGKQVVEIAAE
ncbi:MAG: zinc-binding dehydrogenase [Comamonadaceae bacterium]|nr:zinc-binding dehydrogenase [Comamonadaceae bacterium]